MGQNIPAITPVTSLSDDVACSPLERNSREAASPAAGDGEESDNQNFINKQRVSRQFSASKQSGRMLVTDIEAELGCRPISLTKTGASIASVASRPHEFEVIFEENDAENPLHWPFWYRCWCVFVVSFATWVTTLYSTIYTASIPGLMKEFHLSKTMVTLGMTTYMLGLAAGTLVVAPMSELYGRRNVYLVCLGVWALFIVPCGLARCLTVLILNRFVGALFGAVMIANGPSSVVDVSNPDYLARSLVLFSVAPLNGPVTGPILGGYIFQSLGWRWSNWIVLSMAGLTVLMIATVRETYAPTILRRKAAKLREKTGDPRWWCQYDQDAPRLRLLMDNLSRPVSLFVQEPLLWFVDVWVSISYSCLYLCFVSFPIVFSERRGWSPGTSGLAFLGIGVGIVLATVSEPLLGYLINRQPRDPEGQVLPEAQALVMTIGGISASVGQLGFSWTCLPSTIHWLAPIAFGVPFGFGYTVGLIYSSNYLAGAYSIYAASALAGNVVLRSVFSGILPLAGPRLYGVMSPQWAGTLPGLLEVVTIPIPVMLWRHGSRFRARSRVIQQLREDQERMGSKRLRRRKNFEGRQRAQESP